MRETMFILALLLTFGLNAQDAGDDTDEAQEETTGPSWRDSRPTRPNVPTAPEVERPNFEFKMERPTLDLSTEFEGFKPKVAVQEVEDEPIDEGAEDAEQALPVDTVADAPVIPAEASDEAPIEAEVITEQAPAVVDAASTPEQERPADSIADEFIAEQSVVENRPVATPDELIGQGAQPEAEAPATQLAAATLPVQATSTPSPARAATARARLVPSTMVEPEYPVEAWRDNQEGWVDVRLVVNGDGAVVDAQAVRAQPRRVFDRSAVRAAMQWRFEPVDGLAVSETVSRTYRVSFTMDEQ